MEYFPFFSLFYLEYCCYFFMIFLKIRYLLSVMEQYAVLVSTQNVFSTKKMDQLSYIRPLLVQKHKQLKFIWFLTDKLYLYFMVLKYMQLLTFIIYGKPIAFLCITNIDYIWWKLNTVKGQLISKCPFGVIVSTKIPTKKFDNFCPRIWKVVKS